SDPSEVSRRGIVAPLAVAGICPCPNGCCVVRPILRPSMRVPDRLLCRVTRANVGGKRRVHYREVRRSQTAKTAAKSLILQIHAVVFWRTVDVRKNVNSPAEPSTEVPGRTTIPLRKGCEVARIERYVCHDEAWETV